jgi:hypothetical protein
MSAAAWLIISMNVLVLSPVSCTHKTTPDITPDCRACGKDCVTCHLHVVVEIVMFLTTNFTSNAMSEVEERWRIKSFRTFLTL